MSYPLKKVKRSKSLMVLLLPIIVCMFFVGWVMYVTGRPGSGQPRLAPNDAHPTHRIMIGCVPVEVNGEQ